MKRDRVLAAPHKRGFMVVLVSVSWNGKRSLKSRGVFESRPDAEREKARLLDLCGDGGADYRVCGPRQIAALFREIEAERSARRAKGALRGAKTRAKNGAAAFVRCPQCKAKSKKLRSEMGGLQTRRCQNGHVFEWDKWIADRIFYGGVGAANSDARMVRP